MNSRWLIRVAKWILNLILPFIAIGFSRELMVTISHASIDSTRWSSFVIGGVVFVPLWFVARRYIGTPVEYLATLEHELTHIIVGLLFFKRPLSLRVTAREGGEVILSGGNMWITLAPYFLPSLSLLLLPVSLALPQSYEQSLLALLGVTVAYHLLSTWSELGVMQSDFRKAGVLQSIWLLPVANLVIYGSIIAYVIRGFNGFSYFWRGGAKNVLALIAEFVSYLVGK
jgi:hypothetical protein